MRATLHSLRTRPRYSSSSKRADDGWNAVLRASLGSIVPNRQYPQERCYRAGWVEHPKCIFCLHSKVACVAHVAAMPERFAAEDPQHQQQQKRQRHLVRPKLPQQEREPPSRPVHESATPQQIDDTPMGTLAHRNYSCPSLDSDRARHAPDAGSLVFLLGPSPQVGRHAIF